MGKQQSRRRRSGEPAMVVAASEAKFRGVRKRKWGKYVSEIRLPNSRERIWLGSYDSAEKAARAFDGALFLLRGRNAKFNFPDRLPDVAASEDGSRLTCSEIQAAASKFAYSDPAPCGSEESGRPGSAWEVSSSESPLQSSSQTTETESESTLDLDRPLMDPTVGSDPVRDEDPIDYGMFPGIEDFPTEFYGVEGMTGVDGSCLVDDDDAGLSFVELLLTEDPFLWSY